MLASYISSQIHTDWPSSLRNKGVYFVKRDKVSHLCHLCQSLSVFVKSFTIFVIVNQEPIPHLDEGLNNKEMNEELLNYLTCGDVHPNVLGFHCLCSCYPTGKLYSTEPSSCQCLLCPCFHYVLLSEHFCAWVEEVIVPLFKNESNICKFPKCLADDIKRQVLEQEKMEEGRFKKEINKTQRMQDKFKILDESPRCTSWQQQSTK